MKTLNLTFRMPPPIPLGSKCKAVCDFWVRMHLNKLVHLYTLYGSFCQGKGHEPNESFIEFSWRLFNSDRAVVNHELN